MPTTEKYAITKRAKEWAALYSWARIFNKKIKIMISDKRMLI
jgi:hypothetical protein